VTEHLRYAEDETEAPLRGPLVPVRRTYRLTDVEKLDPETGFPSAEAWSAAFETGAFFHCGRMEPVDRRTAFRMLRGADALFVAVTHPGLDAGDSVEVYLTPSDRPEFPIITVTIRPDGGHTAGVIPRPYTPYFPPPVDPVAEGAVRCSVTKDESGWRAVLALSRSKLDLTAEGFHLNVVRRCDEDTAYAWCDLNGGVIGQVEVFGRAVVVDDPASEATGLALPAEMAVGVNPLRLERADPGVSARVGDERITPDADGAFALTVPNCGPVDLDLVRGGDVVARYHADVPRPLIVAVHEPFLPAGATEFAADVTLNVAGDDAVPVAIMCTMDSGEAATRECSLAPGRHTVTLPVPCSTGAEVTVEATAAVPGLAAPLTARHWCAVALNAGDLDVYRNGIRDLPVRDMYWAVLADAVHILRMQQAGCGAFGDAKSGRQTWMWQEAFVYVPALLYTTEHPRNHHTGDRRLLESAILGMDYALRPTISRQQHVEPDNRSLQAFLLAYELLRDDVDEARRARWAHELRSRVEGVVHRWVRPAEGAYGSTSADCGTGSNHVAYYMANVYLAGDLFDRADWREMAQAWMRRFAKHGAEGHFEERTGVPVNHYTWVSANAVGEYFARVCGVARVAGQPVQTPAAKQPEAPADRVVDDALEAAAGYLTAITTAHGGTMALHDGRNSDHRAFITGDFTLSRTARGRSAARARLLATMGNRPSALRHETLWRCAENAVYFQDGPEEDLTADDEHVFSRGIIVRRDGFHYGLSTIALGPVNGLYRLDPQNILEIFHREAGCILHAGNSSLQPEAGTFCRDIGPSPTVRGLDAPTAPRADYLPITAAIKRLPDGHDVELDYWSFRARLAIHVLSPTEVRLEVTARHLHDAAGPVVFNFFPGVRTGGALAVEGRVLRFGRVRIEAGGDFSVDREFRIMNPYAFEFTYEHKPVRCWTELEPGETFALAMSVDRKGAE